MKNIEEVLEWAENLIVDKTGETLTPIEEVILKGVWSGKKYSQIATEYNDCSESHVKKEAAKLWDKLRDELGEDLKKYNFRSKVEKKHRVSQSSQHCLQVNTVNQVDTLNIDSKLIQSIKTPKTGSPSDSSSSSLFPHPKSIAHHQLNRRTRTHRLLQPHHRTIHPETVDIKRPNSLNHHLRLQ